MTKEAAETLAQDVIVCLYDEGILISQQQYQKLIDIFYQHDEEFIEWLSITSFLKEYILQNLWKYHKNEM